MRVNDAILFDHAKAVELTFNNLVSNLHTGSDEWKGLTCTSGSLCQPLISSRTNEAVCASNGSSIANGKAVGLASCHLECNLRVESDERKRYKCTNMIQCQSLFSFEISELVCVSNALSLVSAEVVELASTDFVRIPHAGLKGAKIVSSPSTVSCQSLVSSRTSRPVRASDALSSVGVKVEELSSAELARILHGKLNGVRQPSNLTAIQCQTLGISFQHNRTCARK